MSRLDELPPDQRAALSLLVTQGRTYAEVAGALAISEHSVHDRAHAALTVLAPALARPLPPEQREQVGDYLLGQDAPGSAAEARALALLTGSAPARAWAQALHGELAQLGGALPSLPASDAPAAATEPSASAAAAAAGESAAPAGVPAPTPAAPGPASRAGSGAGAAPAPAAAAPEGGPEQAAGTSAEQETGGAASRSAPGGRSLRGSRAGGAIVLAVIAAAVVVAVLLIDKGSGHSHGSAAHRATTTAKGTKVNVTAQIVMHPPNPASHAIGAVDVLAEGSRRAFFLAAEKLPATNGFYYAIWLYNSPTSAKALNRAPPVSSSHTLQGGSLLPADAGNFRMILLTRETAARPARPGPIVLQGNFTLGA